MNQSFEMKCLSPTIMINTSKVSFVLSVVIIKEAIKTLIWNAASILKMGVVFAAPLLFFEYLFKITVKFDLATVFLAEWAGLRLLQITIYILMVFVGFVTFAPLSVLILRQINGDITDAFGSQNLLRVSLQYGV